ncbi:MAG TPA: hypothetical protein VEP89_08920 [Draconibacterium sp.]|nr:hypothetical protein [Draconibacterium sp.]
MITTIDILSAKKSNARLLSLKALQMQAAFSEALVVMCVDNMQRCVLKYYNRATHLLLSILPAIHLEPFLLKYIVSTKPCFVRLTGQGLVIVFTRQLLGLLYWPFSLQNTAQPISEYPTKWERHNLTLKQLFEGRIIGTSFLKGASDNIAFDSKS